MKVLRIYSITLLFISILFSSCDRGIKGSGNVIRMERTVPDFNSIRLKGSFNVYIKKDNIQKVEVVTDDNIMPYVETNVYGNTLEIGTRSNTNIRKSTRSDVFISIPSIESVKLDGSGNIRSESVFSGPSLLLYLGGSGSIYFSYEGTNLQSEIDGSGKIQIKGEADSVKLEIDGSGDIDAATFMAKNANAVINGSGNISVGVSDNLVASISGSGNIFYYGSPNVNSSISGSGNISKR